MIKVPLFTLHIIQIIRLCACVRYKWYTYVYACFADRTRIIVLIKRTCRICACSCRNALDFQARQCQSMRLSLFKQQTYIIHMQTYHKRRIWWRTTRISQCASWDSARPGHIIYLFLPSIIMTKNICDPCPCIVVYANLWPKLNTLTMSKNTFGSIFGRKKKIVIPFRRPASHSNLYSVDVEVENTRFFFFYVPNLNDVSNLSNYFV